MLVDATVVKIGGRELDDERWVGQLTELLVARARPLVLVHGGGQEISEVQRALGAEPEWRDGLRVTTPAALRATAMALSGTVNKRIVSALIGAGVEAVGISGEDAGLFRARPAQGGALGRTGEIVEVQPRVIEVLAADGFMPVVSPVSRGADGGPLNVNADEAAAALAVAIGAREILFISNVSGVRSGSTALPYLSRENAHKLIARGEADGGMIPKLRAASRAAAGGVTSVRIGDLDLLRTASAGTRMIPGESSAAA
ncbi:MAG TPA: acetylglutamate kinase [Longimicrobiaceae bacterium]|nr:acetylglutamate kinase [Longimicrobiaceae bacterium]